MSTLEILEERVAGNVSFLSTSGSLDAHTHAQLQRSIDAAISQGVRRFVIEMSRLEFIGSAGINVLTAAAKKAVDLGGGMILLRLNPKIRQVFDVLCLTPLFAIADGRDDAMRKLGITL